MPSMTAQARMPMKFAFTSESTGLEAMFITSVVRTSPTPSGDDCSTEGFCTSVMSMGNAKLASTATSEAMSVLAM